MLQMHVFRRIDGYPIDFFRFMDIHGQPLLINLPLPLFVPYNMWDRIFLTTRTDLATRPSNKVSSYPLVSPQKRDFLS